MVFACALPLIREAPGALPANSRRAAAAGAIGRIATTNPARAGAALRRLVANRDLRKSEKATGTPEVRALICLETMPPIHADSVKIACGGIHGLD